MAYFIDVKVWRDTYEELEEWRDNFLDLTSKDPYSDPNARIQPEVKERSEAYFGSPPEVKIWILNFKLSHDNGSSVKFNTEEDVNTAIQMLEKHLTRATYRVMTKA